ncbi:MULTISPECIES: DUF1561 domain-containing protein [Leptospira]|uniref:PF07598 family protein n=1 Tax=Leptospira weilii str. 2006001853 TaxID=1001589 RepID=A0A828Z2W8_9LEPT|nr:MULTISPECIES: DUF1561 domain-containing protein [Leptospira]EKR64615.1 PF07598 family protein [Leptospira weilii str. 2006001853]EMJ67149.1 PF07598 family protein [Leptospira sp. P2653]EMN43630.1 PF07598 family protein [Leptospira weilii str. LNT 1234]MDL5247444.1 DUF1561 domain-containing protein [Leptospira weilii]QDK27886.1 DUF1561 domain-containing protein [Leptospira weilii]
MGRWIVLTVVLLVSIGVSFTYGGNSISSSGIPGSIVQKPTDKPNDKPIKIIAHNGKNYCYSPMFGSNESYIQLQGCGDKTPKARYDVFQRISYYINNTWLCVTTPEKVIKGETNWDYVNLRPCTINDPQQRWIVKNNAFWTADGRYQLKDVHWLAYISKTSGDYYNHTLDSTMNDWVKTVATPGNVSIQTSIAWDSNWGDGVWNNMAGRYFIRSGGSDRNTTPIYYNPENGHLAQFNPANGLLSCMYSKVGKYNWNWVYWAPCSDAPVTSKENSAYWNIYFETQEGGTITDYQGNILRVTKAGPHWGVAYTVKPSYLNVDTTHSPTSLFFVDKDLLNWVRYTTGNLGNTEQYCPAGNKKSHAHKRVKRNLPSDFQLTDDWIRRFYDIARSATYESARPGYRPQQVGVCGVCLLHSFQMLAELQEYHSQRPLQSGGYFFDTAPDRDPFISFSRRYRELYRLLTNVPATYANRGRVLAYASTMIMMPQYEWESSAPMTTRPEMLSHIRSLINSPPGSIWLVLMRRQRANGTISGHAVPVIRTSEGLVAIRTNTPTTSFNDYRSSLIPRTNPEEILADLEGPGRTMLVLTTIQPVGAYESVFGLMVSNRDCTGEGEDRRGSGRYPISSLVNQCSGGRCTLQ